MKLALFLGITLLAMAAAAQGTDDESFFDTTELSYDFNELDKNHDGFVDVHEFRTGVPGIFEDDITVFFDRYDTDRNGVLTLEEYLLVLKQKNRTATTTAT